NKQLALGSFDGTVKIYNVDDGKLVSTVIDLPKAPEPKTPAAKPDAKPAPAPDKKTEVKKADAKK
ncbi:MAG TPA: heparin-binding hemagglutinin, partial [Armatimonadota bacterium]|nr:heparin-binding hemagglutinin [Armatimonadota bacterium]